MSYDLSIHADDTFSQFTSASDLRSFIGRLENVQPNGDWGFAFGDSKSAWMEIDLEVVSEEGDFLEDALREDTGINCIRLHIPYGFLGDDWQQTYLPAALAIANHLGWPVWDEQTGERITEIRPQGETVKKPWWKFW